MKKVNLCVIILILLYLPSISLAEGDTWTRKADVPTAREGLCTSVVNGKIYAIGGASDGHLPTVEEYDPIADVWVKKCDMLAPNVDFDTSVINGKIYAIGGKPPGQADMGAPRLEEYDPATDTWRRRADMPTPRFGLATSAVNGKICAIGGISVWVGNNTQGLQTVEEYDPKTDTWTEKAHIPSAKYWFSTSVVDGKLYAIGGWNGSRAVGEVEEYNTVTDTWTRKADMPTPRWGLSTSMVNGRIYAIGGFGPLSIVEEYDPATDTWARKADMPTARLWFSTSAANGKIYAIGGTQSTAGVGLSVVEEYDTGMGIRVGSISPQQGRVTGGEPIVISGSGFPPEAIITIGGEPLTQLRVTDALVTGLTPPGIEGEQHITVVLPSISYSSVIGEFLYNPLSDIAVTGIAPASGKQAGGGAGSIVGSGFLPGATVTIGDNPATNVGVTPTLITFTIPQGTEGVKNVVVTNPDGQKATLRGGYTYNPFPVIERVEPGYGGPLRGGTEITITGSNFMEGAVVTIGEKKVEKLDLFSPTELRLKTPPGNAGPKPVCVINPDGQEAILEDGFTYNPAPTVTGISPSAGPLEGGTPITITGTGFMRTLDVLIGDAEASVDRALPTKIIALTPPSDAGGKDVTVVNVDGQKATLEDAFTYNDAPVITRVTPDNGRLAGGTRITIQGGGFQPGAEVRISINQGAYRDASSVEVMSSSIICFQ